MAKMSTSIIKRRVDALETERKRLVERLEWLEKEKSLVTEGQQGNFSSKLDEHADGISELEKCIELEQFLRNQLIEIEHALQKVENGTYGFCDSCGQPINPERLEALPQASLCLSCKSSKSKRTASPTVDERLTI